MLPCCIYKTLRAETIFQDELSEDVGCGELFFVAVSTCVNRVVREKWSWGMDRKRSVGEESSIFASSRLVEDGYTSIVKLFGSIDICI